ncbi:protein of unknown function [Mariniphaga anaerophila]|uniref:DUF4294 domain-containing protein n=1 Tax=Mariniphaga anaerophila TaxID=1484053 RepID=A0A1M5DF94_9BACT|nr:DUF4294 domain-containing protein [Mariniphaga anaerophila]SHF65743.1 protein of unknown function [Mariniphaga anaerophila]
MNRAIKILSIACFFTLAFWIEPKAQTKDTAMVMGIIQRGDTLIHKNILEVTVLPQRTFNNARQERRYSRYVNKVKKVYPYAKLAGEMLQEYEPKYMALEDERERRKMMKDLERQLLDEYKDDLKRMTISEGQILLKLIDRETRHTSYVLIKDFRGGVSAVFWQGIARLFRNDLKAEYDPTGEDRTLEQIVTLIEVGYL